MAEGDVVFYNNFKKELADGNVDFTTDDWRIALVENTYTPNIDTHTDWDDVVADELVATNYTANGESLGTKTVTVDTTNDQADIDFAITTWSSLAAPGTPLAYAVIYNRTPGTDATRTLMCHIEISTQPNGGDFSVDAAAAQFATIT